MQFGSFLIAKKAQLVGAQWVNEHFGFNLHHWPLKFPVQQIERQRLLHRDTCSWCKQPTSTHCWTKLIAQSIDGLGNSCAFVLPHVTCHTWWKISIMRKNFAALAAVAPWLSSEVSCCASRMRMNDYRCWMLYLQREHPDCGEDGKCMVGWRRLSLIRGSLLLVCVEIDNKGTVVYSWNNMHSDPVY